MWKFIKQNSSVFALGFLVSALVLLIMIAVRYQISPVPTNAMREKIQQRRQAEQQSVECQGQKYDVYRIRCTLTPKGELLDCYQR